MLSVQAEAGARALEGKLAAQGDALRAKTAELEDALAALARHDREHAGLASAMQGELLSTKGELAETEEHVHSAEDAKEVAENALSLARAEHARALASLQHALAQSKGDGERGAAERGRLDRANAALKIERDTLEEQLRRAGDGP